MDINEFQLKTNTELEDYLNELQKEFDENKEKIINIHQHLSSLSEKYNMVNDILTKRIGNRNGKNK